MNEENGWNLRNTILTHHPYFKTQEAAAYPEYSEKINQPGKEIYFYSIIVLLLFLAILKAGFEKYFSGLLYLFFRKGSKQRQQQEILLQNSMPSLLFNIFFTVTAGYYLALLIEKLGANADFSFLQLLLYCTVGIGLVYIVKFFVLKFLGWMFEIGALIDNYIFAVFLTNKVFAVAILPLLVIATLTDEPTVNTIAWTSSWLLIFVFACYRYITALGIIRKSKGIGFFHFLLYITVFEVLPTVIIYNGVVLFLK